MKMVMKRLGTQEIVHLHCVS